MRCRYLYNLDIFSPSLSPESRYIFMHVTQCLVHGRGWRVRNAESEFYRWKSWGNTDFRLREYQGQFSPSMVQWGRIHSLVGCTVGHDWSDLEHACMHWRRKWHPTPVFLPGESQGRRSLVGCHLRGHRVGHNWSDLAAAAVQEMQEMWVQSLGQDNPLELEMATCSSILAWKTPWAEEPGRP